MKNFYKFYFALLAYKQQYGDCLVPRGYVTDEGIELGKIVSYISKGSKKVSESEKEQLDSIGFVWNTKKRFKFDKVFELLMKYKEEYGNCNVPLSYVTQDGVRLGKILGNIRGGSRKVSESERKKLDSIGFVWNTNNNGLCFDKIYEMLIKYKEEHGNCMVPQKYITSEGVRLGILVSSIRSERRKISESEREKLDSIGFIWDASNKVPFEEMYKLLVKYVEEHGNCEVPNKYITPEGVHLGALLMNMRYGIRNVSKSERKKLDSIGFIWNVDIRLSFDEVYQLLLDYVKEHGNCNVPYLYVTQEGIRLGTIVSRIRNGSRKISNIERKKLDSIGFPWHVRYRKKI